MLSEAGIDEKTNDAVLKHLSGINEGKERLANSNDNHSTAMWDLLNSAFTPTLASSLNPNAPT